MTNPLQPQACEILSVKKESRHEWTFRVDTDAKPAHGQFMQLSIPMIGEAPISVSAQGDGWLEFTIRSVGKVTNVIFEKEAGDTLFLRGPYGKGWPVEQFRGKHLVVITGGTGLAPVRSMLNMLAADPGFAKSVHLISGFKNEDGIVFHSELRPGRRNSPPSTPWTTTPRRAGAPAWSPPLSRRSPSPPSTATTPSWWWVPLP